MTLNSGPVIDLRELWDLGISPIEACARLALQKGQLIGSLGLVYSVLQSLNSALEHILEMAPNSSELPRKPPGWANPFIAQQQAIESNARNWLIRGLNCGEWIAIGRRIYASGRSELRYVWDGRLRRSQFDWTASRYFGPNCEFRDIRVFHQTNCASELLWRFDRIRNAKTGRPQFNSLAIAMERVAARNSRFYDRTYFKKAVFDVQCELDRMLESGETNEKPSEKTIQNAIRQKCRQLNS